MERKAGVIFELKSLWEVGPAWSSALATLASDCNVVGFLSSRRDGADSTSVDLLGWQAVSRESWKGTPYADSCLPDLEGIQALGKCLLFSIQTT